MSFHVLGCGQVTRERIHDLAVGSVERPLVEPFGRPFTTLHERHGSYSTAGDSKSVKGEGVIDARPIALPEPVDERDADVTLAPYLTVREEAQDDTSGFRHAGDLPHGDFHVSHMLKDLVVGDDIEGVVIERDAITIHLPDAGAEQIGADLALVVDAFVVDIAAEGIDVAREHVLDDLSAPAAVVERSTAMLGGEVGAELVIVHGGNSNATLNNWMYPNNKTER